MSIDVSERSLEEAIECGLLQYGPDACAEDATGLREPSRPYGDVTPGFYRKRLPEDYDRSLCLLPRDVVDFVLATQPKEWGKLKQHHGAAVREQFLKRVASEIERRGALDVLRNGIKDFRRQIPARLLQAGERPQRGDGAALPGEPVRGGAPTPLQQQKREQPRSRAVPERHSDLHGRNQEPAYRAGHRRCHPAI